MKQQIDARELRQQLAALRRHLAAINRSIAALEQLERSAAAAAAAKVIAIDSGRLRLNAA